MPRYKLRTLLIVLALGPPVLASIWLFPTRAAIALSCVAVAAVILPVAILVWRNGGFDQGD
jgi:hypothetical protein